MVETEGNLIEEGSAGPRRGQLVLEKPSEEFGSKAEESNEVTTGERQDESFNLSLERLLHVSVLVRTVC